MPKTRKTPPKFDWTVIPDGAFVVFRTEYPMQLAHALNGDSDAAAAMDSRGITGTILDHESTLTALSDDDLRTLGLKRIHTVPVRGAH